MEGNEHAINEHGLTREGSSGTHTNPKPFIGIAITTIKNEIKELLNLEPPTSLADF